MSDPRNESRPETRKGWSWFERGESTPHTPGDAAPDLPDADRDLRVAYARCFSGADGEKVLAHLRALTLERAFGPDTPGRTLRHIEGQRQLVAYIIAQYRRGHAGG